MKGVRQGGCEGSTLPSLSWAGKQAVSPSGVTAERVLEVFGHGEEQGMLFHADSRDLLSWMLANGYAGRVDLAYLDPPFGSGAIYSRKVQLRGTENSLQLPAFHDIWADGDYLQFMYERLLLVRELLAESGSLYLHVDTAQSHYLKVMCDEIFGKENFQREIVWRIGWVSGYKSQAKNWIRNHDVILFYSKDPDRMFFEKQYAPYVDGYKRRSGNKGRGHPLEDTWNCSEHDRLDSIQIKSFSVEKTGYPTQKNEALLQRIIQASCPEGGLVLDCFSGSGTTAAVSRKLDRRWMVGDVSASAVHTARIRLHSEGSGQLAAGFSIRSLTEPGAETPSADVSFTREKSKVHVQIDRFWTPAEEFRAVLDWRSVVDCVLIDLHHREGSFRVDIADIPATRQATIRSSYRVQSAGRVAVKLIDLLGNEIVVTEPQ